MNGRTFQRALLLAAALLLAFGLYNRQAEPTDAPGRAELPDPSPDPPSRRVSRIPPVPPPDEPVPAVASDTLDRAEAVLAEVIGGVRVSCPIPQGLPPLDIPETVGGVNRTGGLVQHHGVVRGVLPWSMPNPYGVPIRPRLDTVIDCTGIFPGTPEARACHDEAFRASQGVPQFVAKLLWEDSEPGAEIPCRIEPMGEVSFHGRLTVADGRTPAEAGLELLSIWCIGVTMAPDGTFTGTRHPDMSCGLLAKHPTLTVRPSGINVSAYVDPSVPLEQEVELGEPLTPPIPMDEQGIAILEQFVEETRTHRTPLVIALERTDLSDDVRAQLEIWRAIELRPAEDRQELIDAYRSRDEVAP